MTGRRPAGAEAHPFAAGTVHALVAAIEVNDVVDPLAALPAGVGVEPSGDQLAAAFALSRQLWRERFDAAAVIALTARLRRGEQLDPATRRAFKQVRAAFKHLRFACYLYDARHRAPPLLSLVTLEMGELQDAARVGRDAAVRRHAAALRVLLTAPMRALLRRETLRFRAATPADVARFTLAQVASLRPLLAASEVRAHPFHAARKVVSRQVSYHDDLRTLFPDGTAADHHHAMARWLASLNGRMGRFHDELVTRAASGAFDYRHDTFALPAPIRDGLEALVARYLGASSSNPPSA